MLAKLLTLLLGQEVASMVLRVLFNLLWAFVPALVIGYGVVQNRVNRRRPQRLQRHGLLNRSNLADQYNSKYTKPENDKTNQPVRVKALYIHPIKSCKYIEVEDALLTKTGFAFDRCFAFATMDPRSKLDTPYDWHFITQRTKPMMSQIEVQLWLPGDGSIPTDPWAENHGCLIVTFPNPDPPTLLERLEVFVETWSLTQTYRPYLVVPLMPTSAQIKAHQIEVKTFEIHGRGARGLDISTIPTIEGVLPKLKKFLKIPERSGLALLRCTPDTLARTEDNLAPLSFIGTPSVHGFTDEQPININSLSSVHAVSALIPAENRPLNALRYRANIWVTGSPAYFEESWRRLRILPKGYSKHRQTNNTVPTLSVVCRTARCTLPNVDPNSGRVTEGNPPPDRKKGKPQPSTALSAFRMIESTNPQALGYLGIHCVPEDQYLKNAGHETLGLHVAVGDEIEPIETGTHVWGSTKNEY